MFVLALICAFAFAYAQYVPIVNTTEGRVQGSLATDGNYFVFYGVNYGGSVSGGSRFKVNLNGSYAYGILRYSDPSVLYPRGECLLRLLHGRVASRSDPPMGPKPVGAATGMLNAAPSPPVYPGVFHAINSGVICAHPTSRGIVGVEDCLTLSIHTASLTASQPVLVWLQGEEYTSTDTTLRSFKNFVDRNVVVVNVNYRLSIFGFLCLGVPEAPGNAGLKDVVQALKWIKVNIAGFGGNPNNVVLFGHGSGAAMVDLLTLSPSAENLVHKAITQSGSVLSPGAIAYKPIEYAEAVGAKLGYTGKSRQELGRLLTTTDITLLATALTQFQFYNNTALFAPCIENNVDSNNTIISDAPINIIRFGNYTHIPYMAGYANKEGTVRAQEAVYSQWLEKMERHFDHFIQVDLDIVTNSNMYPIVKSIREFYFEYNRINMETIENYLDYHGDTMILASAIRGVRERALTSKAEVFLYEFAYRGKINSDWDLPDIPLTSARTPSIPNAAIWDPILRFRFPYFVMQGGEVSPNFTVPNVYQDNNPHARTMTFWNNFYETLYVAPSPVSSAA